MNYYEHHIGDYASHTAHLSLVEDACYSRMLRRYYLTETHLPADTEQVARLVNARTPEEREAVVAVLQEFFVLADDGWHQARCDREIARYLEKQGKAKASADARWRPVMRTQCERNANAMPSHSERNAHQSPDTSLHTPKDQDQKRARSAPVAIPDWLDPKIWQDWHEYRNSRKGWTLKAKELSLRTLANLRAEGHDLRACVDRSIECGYAGLFAAPTANARAGPPPPAPSKTRQMYDAIGDRINALSTPVVSPSDSPRLTQLGPAKP